ncbi:MAG: flavodoxin family protein [Anaerolineae bacterium]|jgi:flavodoxin
MQALVVYESFFGNTERVANAVGAGIGEAVVGEPGAVAVRKVSEVSPADLAGLQLLVVGAPTRAFRPSPGVAQWLRGLSVGALSGVAVAAFDTRISPQDANSAVLRFMVRLFGWAAEKIAKGLTARGGHEAAPAMGFFVAASEGPLKEGELDRAAAWARQVVAGA